MLTWYNHEYDNNDDDNDANNYHIEGYDDDDVNGSPGACTCREDNYNCS